MGLILNKVNHKVVKPNTLKEHAVNVRAVETESSSFYAERCSRVMDILRRGGGGRGGDGRGGDSVPVAR